MNATATASEYGVHADQNRWLGIDFSGDRRKWSAGCSKSNVWIADIRPLNDVVQLVDLRRVRELFGDGSPFELLAGLLAKRAFLAAAIDAPFSVPKDFLPNGSHKALLEVVAKLSLNTSFPDAQTFADAVIKGRRMAVPKPLRETERMWQERGLNVRSMVDSLDWCSRRRSNDRCVPVPSSQGCMPDMAMVEKRAWIAGGSLPCSSVASMETALPAIQQL